MNDTPAACHLSLISVASRDTLTADPAADAAVSVAKQGDRSSFSSFSSIRASAVRDSLSGSISLPIGHQRSRAGLSLTTLSILCLDQSNLLLLANSCLGITPCREGDLVYPQLTISQPEWNLFRSRFRSFASCEGKSAAYPVQFALPMRRKRYPRGPCTPRIRTTRTWNT